MTPGTTSSSARNTPPDHRASAPRAEQWPGLLDELDVQILVLDAIRDAGLLELFQAHPSWAIDFQDDRSVLLVRTNPEVGIARS
jgi:hypothetical protein